MIVMWFLRYTPALLAIAAAAYFDMVRDATLTAGILAAVGFTLLVVIDAADRWCATYYVVHHRPEPEPTNAAAADSGRFHHDFDEVPGRQLF
jgi:hypothetical protein